MWKNLTRCTLLRSISAICQTHNRASVASDKARSQWQSRGKTLCQRRPSVCGNLAYVHRSYTLCTRISAPTTTVTATATSQPNARKKQPKNKIMGMKNYDDGTISTVAQTGAPQRHSAFTNRYEIRNKRTNHKTSSMLLYQPTVLILLKLVSSASHKRPSQTYAHSDLWSAYVWLERDERR